jgi:putative ABC transport system ATP-binding protein
MKEQDQDSFLQIIRDDEMDNHGNGKAVVQVDGLQRYYRMGNEVVRALDGINLEIQAGEFFGISGTSGSGKSTLLYILGGMDRPTSGSLVVAGSELSNLDENELAEYRRSCIGFVYQSFQLLPSFSALQNVELPMIFNKIPHHRRQEIAREALQLMGLGDRLHHRPPQMSGGQQQRVAIARALVNQPTILLADEPTGNLDSHTSQEVVSLLRDLACQQGVTVIIVSHDLDLIRMTDRYIRLHDGRVVDEVRGIAETSPVMGQEVA